MRLIIASSLVFFVSAHQTESSNDQAKFDASLLDDEERLQLESLRQYELYQEKLAFEAERLKSSTFREWAKIQLEKH
jgi:hypothetical protein